MDELKKAPSVSPLKSSTGIKGFDEITHGGLPHGRTALLERGTCTLGQTQTLLQALRLEAIAA